MCLIEIRLGIHIDDAMTVFIRPHDKQKKAQTIFFIVVDGFIFFFDEAHIA